MTKIAIINDGNAGRMAAIMLANLPPATDRPVVAEQQGGDWKIEILNKGGTHHSYVPRYAGNIAPGAAMAALNQTLDASRFSARIVVA